MDRNYQPHGLYVLSDTYFTDFNYSSLKDNKHESRPYYFAIYDKDGIIWMVPLSSQVEKYRKSIIADEAKRGKGKCIYHYIAKVFGKESVFLIGDAIPVTENYIKRPFEIMGKPFIIEDKNDIRNIRSKLSRFLALVKNGKLKPDVDILKIQEELLCRR